MEMTLLRAGWRSRLAGTAAVPTAASALLAAQAAQAQGTFITVASTTYTEQSGLFRHLLPEFRKASGIEVRVVALGTGQALDMGRRGDADVVFVHDKAAEEKFVADGFGVKRLEVMYNDFVIVGPKADPAKARGKDVIEGLKKIAAAKAPFASRADKSGTHAAEIGILFANELLDALPVHRVIATEQGLREVYVTVRADRLVTMLGPLSSEAVATFLAEL